MVSDMDVITEERVSRLKPGERLMCGKVTGFGVRRTPTRGRVVFFVRRHVAGKDLRERIGTHPIISVREARLIARQRIGAMEAMAPHLSPAPFVSASDPRTAQMLEQIMLRLGPSKEESTLTFAELNTKLQGDFATMSANTTRVYNVILKAELLPTFGNTRVEEITAPVLQRWFTKFAGKNEQQGNNCLKLMLTMLRRAERYGWVSAAPSPKIKRYKGNTRKGIAEEDVKRLAAHLERLLREQPTPQVHALIFLLNSGERKQACVSLKTSEVDLEKKCITKKRKGGKIEPLTISDYLVEFLRSIWPTNGEYFFPNTKGVGHICPRWILRYMQRICAELNITTSDGKRPVIHTLRHTFASLLARDVPLVDIKLLLGHSQLSTTMRYTHGDKTQARAGANRLTVTQVSKKRAN